MITQSVRHMKNFTQIFHAITPPLGGTTPTPGKPVFPSRTGFNAIACKRATSESGNQWQPI
jgi:hypothetical protein